MKKRFFTLALLLFIQSRYSESLPLSLIKLPPGFSIHLYAKVPGAREMALGKNGIVYVGTRNQGKVYAVLPNKKHTQAEKVRVIASGLYMPNGVAYHSGSLYVAAVNRVLRFDQIEQHLDRPKFVIVTKTLPRKYHHGWRYIKFGPDGWLYLGIGAPCNVCLSKDPRFATILRMKPDGSHMQIYAKGVRNSVGFTWNPQDRTLWFTDNGRDWLGDDFPPDELNHASHPNMHFGFPYVNGNNVPDPDYGRQRPADLQLVPPVLSLGPHVAALGMVFYTGKNFPKKYRGQILIAEHGSWNRSKKIGYRVMLVTLHGNKPIGYQPFATGWLQGQNEWGRPVDLLIMSDGSLLLSDDYAGVLYRIIYD